MSLCSRSTVLRLFSLSLVLPCLAFADSDTPPLARNILFIAVDDLNDWVGALGGYPQAKTPHLDRLLDGGMTFTNAHCASPSCKPSRTALMSGVRPHLSGITKNGSDDTAFLKDVLTLNRYLTESGITTVGGGKLYHGVKSEPDLEKRWTARVGNFPGSAN